MKLSVDPQTGLPVLVRQDVRVIGRGGGSVGGVKTVVAGTNVTVDSTDPANPIVSATGGGGGGSTNLAATLSATNTIVTSDTGTDATIPAVDGTNAGVMTPTQKTKLDGIATGATANSSDATLLARANHTGTQLLSTISNVTASAAEVNYTTGVTSGIQTQLDGKQPLNSNLTTVGGLTATTDNVIQSVGSAWASRTPAQLKTSMSLVKADVGLGNVDNTSDANKPVSTATQTALDLKGQKLNPTAVKTSNYSAAANDFVPVDTTSGNVTITFPTAPADGTLISIKHVVRGGTNTVGLALGGSDVFNVASGATTGTITLVNQAILCQYKASTAIWYVLADDLGLSQLDLRYQPLDGELTALAGLTSAADKVPYFSGSGAAAVADFTATARSILDDTSVGAVRTTLGVGTADSPQFTAIELGAASDTTITRTGAGAIAVEGTAVLLSGGALGTPSSATLTNATGLPISGLTASTATALGVGSVELGHATDTTLSRSAAGTLAVEGVDVLTTSNTKTVTNKTLDNTNTVTVKGNTVTIQDQTDTTKQVQFDISGIPTATTRTIKFPNSATVLVTQSTTDTLTNKRITKRVDTSETSSGTPTLNTDNFDFKTLTALAANITSMTTNLSGSPTNGQIIGFAFTDNGTARTIAWGTSFESSTVLLPTTTVISTRLDVWFIYNSATSKWRCASVY